MIIGLVFLNTSDLAEQLKPKFIMTSGKLLNLRHSDAQKLYLTTTKTVIYNKLNKCLVHAWIQRARLRKTLHKLIKWLYY